VRRAGWLALPALLLLTGVAALQVGGEARPGAPGPTGAARDDVLTIDVAGRRYWWDVWYRDPVAARNIRGANEIHIPTGRPVEIRVRDAGGSGRLRIRGLHRFPWLAGGSFTIEANRPGVYRGGAAELFRRGRPVMELLVVAHPPEQYAHWWEQQLRPAAAPTQPLAVHGQQVFLSTGCSLCHTIRGTEALAKVGPDLTHFASRRELAAGAAPNNRGYLSAWIAAPHTLKPGSFMPAIVLPGADMTALVGYLETLR
jgi:cytochrome c oxidase subunit II